MKRLILKVLEILQIIFFYELGKYVGNLIFK